MTEVTRLIESIREGEDGASEQLLPLVYDELRRLAKDRLAREKPGQTLQATALVHEAYVRLIGSNSDLTWNSRAHFFGAAAEAMRRILIDQARKRQTQKHGGRHQRVELQSDIIDTTRDAKMLALDDALSRLEAEDAKKAELVKLRFFAGLTIRETAAALDLSTATVERYWAYSRAWLQREMNS